MPGPSPEVLRALDLKAAFTQGAQFATSQYARLVFHLMNQMEMTSFVIPSAEAEAELPPFKLQIAIDKDNGNRTISIITEEDGHPIEPPRVVLAR